MGISYDTTLQDEIALIVSGRSYSGLQTDQKKLIDNAWTSGTPTGGAIKRAMDTIGTWAEFFTMDASAGIPVEWRTWLVLEAAAGCVGRFTTADEKVIRTDLSSARRHAITSYSRSDPEDVTGTAHLLGNVLAVRQFVVSHCLRQARPLLPEPYMVDEALVEILRDTWNYAEWSFKTQTATLTIGTDGSVSIGGGLIVKRIVTDRLFYTGTAKGNELFIADGETILTMQTQELADGRPEYVRVLADSGGADGGVRFDLDRTPDQEYTAKAEVVTSIGAMTTLAEVASVIAAFPVDMVSYIKKKALATVLENCSRVEQARMLEHECDDMLMGLVEQETPQSDTVRDQNRQFRFGLGRPPSYVGGFL